MLWDRPFALQQAGLHDRVIVIIVRPSLIIDSRAFPVNTTQSRMSLY